MSAEGGEWSLSRRWVAIYNQPFPRLVALTWLAATTLSNGVIWGSVPLMAIGAALSAVFPWGIAATWLIRRWRRGPLRVSRLCLCGHDRLTHHHYRAGDDCGTCGCPGWRRSRRGMRWPWRRESAAAGTEGA